MARSDERTKQDNGITFPMAQDIKVAAKVEGIALGYGLWRACGI